MDWTKGTEILGVKVLDVTKNSIMVCAAFNPLPLSLLYILKGEGLKSLIYLLGTMLAKAEFACVQIVGEDTISCDALSTER